MIEPLTSLRLTNTKENQICQHISARIMRMFPSIIVDQVKLSGELEVVFKSSDLDYQIEEAVKWGDNFEFPRAVYTNDLSDFKRCNFDLEKLVRSRQEAMKDSRMGLKNLDLVDDGHPDFELLKELVGGIRVYVDPDFKPDRNPPPLSEKYDIAFTAVNKM